MKEKSLTKNSLYYLFYQIFNIVFPLASGIYVARILLPDAVGQVAYAQNIANYFVVLAFMGIPTYGLREMAKARNDKEEASKLYSELFFINLISTIFFLVVYVGLILIVPSFREQIYLYLVTGISIAINALNIDWLYEGLEEYRLISIRNLIFKAVSFLCLVLFVRGPDDYLIYASITVIGTSGNYIFNVIFSHRLVHLHIHGLNLKRHLKSILILSAVNISIEISTMVDTTMLGAMISDKAVVAYYSYGSKIKGILLNIINTFTIVLVPRISYYFSQKKYGEYNSLLTKTLKIILLLSVSMIIGIWFTADYLVPAVYGEEFTRSTMVLKILSLNLLISPVGYLLGSRVMLVSDHEKWMPLCVGAGAVVNAGLNALFIPYYQEIGASITSVISELVTTVVYIALSHKYFHIQSIKRTLINIGVAGAIIVGYLLGCSFIPLRGWIVVIIQIFGTILLYFGILLIMKDDIVSGYFNKFKEKLRHRKGDEA